LKQVGTRAPAQGKDCPSNYCARTKPLKNRDILIGLYHKEKKYHYLFCSYSNDTRTTLKSFLTISRVFCSCTVLYKSSKLFPKINFFINFGMSNWQEAPLLPPKTFLGLPYSLESCLLSRFYTTGRWRKNQIHISPWPVLLTHYCTILKYLYIAQHWLCSLILVHSLPFLYNFVLFVHCTSKDYAK